MADLYNQRIYELKRELSDLGYHAFQIETIIRETIIGKSRLDNPNEQQAKVVNALERQVRFAAKCHGTQSRGV